MSLSLLLIGCSHERPRLATYKEDASKTIVFSFSNGATCAYIEPMLVGTDATLMWRIMHIGASPDTNEMIYMETRRDAITLTENLLCPTKHPPSDGLNATERSVTRVPQSLR